MILLDSLIDQIVDGNLSYHEYIAMSEEGFVDNIKSATGAVTSTIKNAASTVTNAVTSGPAPAPLGTPGTTTGGNFGSLPKSQDKSIFGLVGNFIKGGISAAVSGGSGGTGLGSIARQYGSGIGAAGQLIGGLGRAAGLSPVSAIGNAIGGVGSILNPPRPAINNELPRGFSGSSREGFGATQYGGFSPVPKSMMPGAAPPSNAIGQNDDGSYMAFKGTSSTTTTGDSVNKPYRVGTLQNTSSTAPVKAAPANSTPVPKAPSNSTSAFKPSNTFIDINGRSVNSAIADPVRQILAQGDLTLTSGRRSYSHNRAVGGVTNSRHLDGMAADFAGTRAAMDRGLTKVKSLGGQGIIHKVRGGRVHLHSSFGPGGM